MWAASAQIPQDRRCLAFRRQPKRSSPNARYLDALKWMLAPFPADKSGARLDQVRIFVDRSNLSIPGHWLPRILPGFCQTAAWPLA